MIVDRVESISQIATSAKEALQFLFYFLFFSCITDHHPCLSLSSLCFPATDKAPSALFQSDPQLPGAVISDRC